MNSFDVRQAEINRAARNVWGYTRQAVEIAIEELAEWCSVNKDDPCFEVMEQRRQELIRDRDILAEWVEDS